MAHFNPTSAGGKEWVYMVSPLEVKFPFNVTPRCLRVLTRWIVVPSFSTLPPLFELIGRCSLFSALKTIPGKSLPTTEEAAVRSNESAEEVELISGPITYEVVSSANIEQSLWINVLAILIGGREADCLWKPETRLVPTLSHGSLRNSRLWSLPFGLTPIHHRTHCSHFDRKADSHSSVEYDWDPVTII